MNVIINDLHPFNEFYFRTCFLNAFFSIMQKHHVNLLHVIGDLEPCYAVDQNGQLALHFINELPFENLNKDLANLVGKSGMNVEYSNRLDLHSFIGKEINRDRPVIAIVDCFYLPYRHDTYEKRHLYHPILLTGYDDKNYHIIDQVNDESLTFDHRMVECSAFKKAYLAYQESYQEEYIAGLTSYGYVTGNKKTDDIRKKTLLARKNNMDAILNGLESLVQLKETYQITSEGNSLEDTVLVMNDIINFWLLERQKIVALDFPADTQFLAANKAVIDLWTSIRREIYLCHLSAKRRTLVTQEKIVNLFGKIYQSERAYYLLFDN